MRKYPIYKKIYAPTRNNRYKHYVFTERPVSSYKRYGLDLLNIKNMSEISRLHRMIRNKNMSLKQLNILGRNGFQMDEMKSPFSKNIPSF